MPDRFSADPTVVFMTSVLDDLSAGRLHIPRFQRPLVWSWQQRQEFFDSIFEGLPIGALMLWVSEGDPISTYDRLGPHALPAPKAGAEVRYLMDGVQRVSTLFGALRAREEWEDFDDIQELEVEDFVVFADLDCGENTDRFLRKVDIEDQITKDPTRFLPLSIVLDSRELLRFQREVPTGMEGRVDVADEVATAFRQYKIPIITLASTSLSVVTKSFERINSRGADMSELHMLNALTYSEDFDLLRTDSQLRTARLAPVGWEGVDSDVVLRCIKMRVGADIYTKNPDEVARRLKGRTNEVDVVFGGLARTATFLREVMGLANPSLIPYRMQIVGLCSVLYDREWEEITEKLLDWMWLTTYTEVFGLSARQSENAIRDLQSYVKTEKFNWSLRDRPTVRPLMGLRTDFRSARVKAFFLALAERLDQKGMAEGTGLLTRFGREAFALIPLEGVDRSSAGCRFLLDPAEVSGFRHRLLHGTLTPQEMRDHFISEESLYLLELSFYDAFAERRAFDIFQFESQGIVRPSADRLGLTVSGVNDDLEGAVE